MNEALFAKALHTAGSVSDVDESGRVVFSINGFDQPMKSGNATKMVRAICRKHAVWFINNLGKAMLKLNQRNAAVRPHCGGDLTLTPDDVACVKAVLSSLGATVALTERYVITLPNTSCAVANCLTLRVDEFLYVQPPDEPRDETAMLVELVRHAAESLVLKIMQKNASVAKSEEVDLKVKQRRAKQKEYRAAKKKRTAEPEPEAEAEAPKPQANLAEFNFLEDF